MLLTLRAGEKVFRIVFDRGVVVAASSPVTADSVARVGLTSHLITPAQVDEVRRRFAASPGADEVDVLAEVARLPAEQVRGLRRRLIMQRAARTFAVEGGAYELDERPPLPVLGVDIGVDVRAIIYIGARGHLSELRLARELRQLGTRFALKPDALDDLPRYGFTRTERPVLEALRRGTSLAELEANQRELDPRVAQAVIYALASCGALLAAESLASGSGAMRPLGRPATPAAPLPAAPLDGRRDGGLDGRLDTALDAPLARASSPVPREPMSVGGRSARPPAPRAAVGRPRPQPPQPLVSATQLAAAQLAGAKPPVPAAAPQPAAPKQQQLAAAQLPPRTSPPPVRLQPRTSPPPVRARSRTMPPRSRSRTPAAPPPIPAQPPLVPRPPVLPPPIPASAASPPVAVPMRGPTHNDFTPLPRSMLDAFRTNRTTLVRPNALAAHEVTALIARHTALLDRGADHFTLLGIPFGAPIEDVHAAFVELSRHLRPTRLAELGIDDESFAAQRLLAQIGIAFTVLTDRILRSEYIAALEGEGHRLAAGPR